MKEDIHTILGYLDLQGDERIVRLRKWVLSSWNTPSDELNQAIIKLRDETKQIDSQNYPYLGVYNLFLGCLYYEADDHQNAIHSLQNAINEIWRSEVNKSLTHWLLGLSYYQIEEYPKACEELIKALDLLATNTCVNTLRVNAENCNRMALRQKIQNDLNQLREGPLFRYAPPEPAQTDTRPQPEELPMERGNMEHDIPKENFSYQEINTGGSVTFQFIQTILPAQTQSAEKSSADKPDNKSAEENNLPFEETRTDGFLSFQSLPVYEQTSAASKYGKPEIPLHEIGFAETQIIILENAPHRVHPLKTSSNEINISVSGKKWGWVKVLGHSMNNINSIANKTPICNGNFILVQFAQDGDENDIVLASFEDEHTSQPFLTVKRYRKDKQTLQSETTEAGPEYEEINLNENNARILGIVYAVAKPI